MKTIACHLAWHLADAGHRVLVLDLDRQCNASTALRDFEQLGSCKPLFEPGYAAPEGLQRAIYSNRMAGEYDADYGKALTCFRANFPALKAAYDYCVIDTPPTWSWINFAALMVCDDLIVPVEPGPFGSDSTRQLSNSKRSRPGAECPDGSRAIVVGGKSGRLVEALIHFDGEDQPRLVRFDR